MGLIVIWIRYLNAIQAMGVWGVMNPMGALGQNKLNFI